ncbi:DUF5348 domain-containing protein [Nostoc sp.]
MMTELLEIRSESGGTRLYLMNKPIHAGDCLQVLVDTNWYDARCECDREAGKQCWYLIVFKPEGEEILEDFSTLLCRFGSNNG